MGDHGLVKPDVPQAPDGSLELRCFCRRKPLLAICGRDKRTGEPYVHIKTWKGQRLYTEVVITAGTARIHCRECLRWHTIRIKIEKVTFVQEPLPASIAVA